MARVAIVQSAATLVAGDRTQLRISVADGARLELIEISATIAYPGARSEQLIEIEIGAGARLAFMEQPLVVTSGAQLDRWLSLKVGAGARVLHFETIVFGRHCEALGHARLYTRVSRDSHPLVEETIDTSDSGIVKTQAVLGKARVMGSLLILGLEEMTPSNDWLVLGSGDAMVRRLAEDAIELQGLEALCSELAKAHF